MNAELINSEIDVPEVSTSVKVTGFIAIAVYIGTCYLAGRAVGNWMDKRNEKFSANGLHEVVFSETDHQ
jgi:hypothetical protein